MTIAYVREGVGGSRCCCCTVPGDQAHLVAQHRAARRAGFEVIAPDFRGHGDSSLAPDNFYDIAAYSIDCYTLVHDVLGHEHCAVAGGDVGGVVLFDLGLRYPGFVTHAGAASTPCRRRSHAVYEAAGLPPDDVRERRATADYFIRQATEPEVLLAELDTPERRQAWVAPMYGHRLWGTPNAFTAEEVAFHTEPYADADKLRASWGVYEQSAGKRAMEDVPQAVRADTGPDAGAVRPRRPRGAAVVPVEGRGRVHRLHRTAVRARRRATSCSGKRPTPSTRSPRPSAADADRACATRRLLDRARDAEHRRFAERVARAPARRSAARRRRYRTAPRSPAWPARFVGIVHTSLRYIASGSAVLAPSSNATVGVVGASSTSNCSYARAKSRMISVRTRCACP